MPYDYDLVVLGAGPAGEKGAAQAAYFGKRVALVEREAEPGGRGGAHRHAAVEDAARDRALPLGLPAARALRAHGERSNTELAVPRLLSRKDAVRELEVGAHPLEPRPPRA